MLTVSAAAAVLLCLKLGVESWGWISGGSGGPWKNAGAEVQVLLSKDELEMLVPKRVDYLEGGRSSGLSRMDLRSQR